MQNLRFGVPLDAWDEPSYGVDVAISAESPMRNEYRSEYEDITARVTDDYLSFRSLPFVTDSSLRSIEQHGFIVTLPSTLAQAELSNGKVVHYSSKNGDDYSAYRNAAVLFSSVAGQLLNIHFRGVKLSDVTGTFDEKIYDHLMKFLTEKEATLFHLPSSRFKAVLDNFVISLTRHPDYIQAGMLTIVKKNGWLQG